MGIEISGNSGRMPHEAVEASKAQTAAKSGSRPQATGGQGPGGGAGDQIRFSDKAAQMQALEAQIANLPVVDTQRVQDVQRTMATGAFQVEPARVADKVLTFEAGLGKPGT